MKSKSKPISNNYSNLRLEKSEYDNQLFLNCDFSNARLNGVEIIDCFFEN